jgi:hypothetical protein
MSGMRCGWRLACVVSLGLLAPSPALAGPYFGDWSWLWQPSPNCDRGVYSPLHYWAPEAYRVRQYCRPSNLDQYPPGPTPPVPPSFEYQKYCCPSAPAVPSSPYANPTAYYGREIAPPRQ